jgi:putative ABC transport system permease protein
MLNDLKYALRVIWKYPLSNGVIVFTIGALVAVIGSWYATFRTIDLSEMPFKEPDRIMRFWRTGKTATTDRYPFDIYKTVKEKSQSFEKLGALTQGTSYTLTEAGEPVHLRAVHCNSEVLEITGLKPVLGRFFSPVDEEEGNREIVILAEHIWQKNFQSRKDILGENIILNEKPYTVVGVAPEPLGASHLARTADLWMPRTWRVRANHSDYVTVVGLIKPEVDVARAQAELNILIPPIEEARVPTEYEERRYKGGFSGIRLAKLDKYIHRSGTGENQALYANIFGIVLMACVVLIACFNMTSLFLVQATSRAREMAVRLSVGASRWRIVRQMLLESMILSLAGGALGLFAALAISSFSNSQNIKLTFDPVLYGTALGAAAVIGALVSILPALRAGRTDLSLALKDGGQSSATRTRHRLRNFLVGSQIAMATLLTMTAVLFCSAFLGTAIAKTNFDADRLVTLEVKLDRKRYREPEKVSAFAQRILVALNEMPGVERATVCSPGVGSTWRMNRNVTFLDNSREYPDARVGIVQTSPNYFESLGQTLRQGRYFSSGNEILNEVIVNQEFVRSFAPDRSPIGEQFRLSGHGVQVFSIIGVVDNQNAKLEIRELQPHVYISHLHPMTSSSRLGVLVETKADAVQFGLAVREAVMRLDSLQPVGPPLTVAAVIEKNVRPMRIAIFVMMGMAGFGLCMSLMGVYSVVAYAVIERTREMGIRMALGATRVRIVRTVMSEGTRLLMWGGIPAAVLATVAIRALPLDELPGMNPDDPKIYLIGIVAVALAGLLAALLPARKMVKLNPSQALRHE